MKIVFAGTPEFAATALSALYAAGHFIQLVLTQPDRPAGRGMQLQSSPVKQFAQAHDLPVAQPVSLKPDGKFPDIAQDAHAQLSALAPDVMVVAAYGLILPRSVLAIPKFGCINIHASLLPRWRGAAPIHRAIEAGDQESGITIMQMEEGLDTGPMLLMHRVPIGMHDTTGRLHDQLAAIGGTLIVQALQRLERGSLAASPQPEHGVTYAAKIVKDEAILDFKLPAEVLSRKIRAFNPHPGAVARFNGTALKVWMAEVIKMPPGAAPGQVVQADAEGVLVACGIDALRLTVLQKPGGKQLAAAEFLKGFDLSKGHFA